MRRPIARSRGLIAWKCAPSFCGCASTKPWDCRSPHSTWIWRRFGAARPDPDIASPPALRQAGLLGVDAPGGGWRFASGTLAWLCRPPRAFGAFGFRTFAHDTLGLEQRVHRFRELIDTFGQLCDIR